eukprot:8575097-Pyramimonas_sp.AAC.1
MPLRLFVALAWIWPWLPSLLATSPSSWSSAAFGYPPVRRPQAELQHLHPTRAPGRLLRSKREVIPHHIAAVSCTPARSRVVSGVIRSPRSAVPCCTPAGLRH